MVSLLPLPLYSPATESWQSYLARFKCYLEANALTNLTDNRKRALFHTVCGSEVFEKASALVAPLAVQAAPWNILTEKLKGHYAPKVSRITARHAFHHQIQTGGETIKAIEEAQAAEAAKHSTAEIRKANSTTISKKPTSVHHGEISNSEGCSDEEDDVCRIKQKCGKVKR
ncbi:Hypothetical predicted protein [Podarcis lilfordi]|uniref:Uncharacterized protein n=1 Tax=Podarcis lilfordi TaxID=74358 RepID=A0AA35LCR0_9SAUR|nr:Hypothetical predicted protein [Podarcis lilfordi]